MTVAWPTTGPTVIGSTEADAKSKADFPAGTVYVWYAVAADGTMLDFGAAVAT